ncbi:relaxase/mobilization nuclease domain-containing protein [Dysgonomonas sp. BGC7]|nr:relaxase/mobilization nuclease domain-containing protein [Dysgonomonas sp. BGC7]
MIGKISKGAAFKGCIRYVTGKQDTKLLAADGVLLQNRNNIIQSFITQSMMKPDIKQPVGHISLSYSPDDEKKLTDGAMVTLAKEYMREMNITDTQYIIVRHFDNGNPHVHVRP